MNKLKIAILGSTSHIAKGLIHNFLRHGNYRLHLYTRSSLKTRDFLSSIGKAADSDCTIHEGYAGFSKGLYDVVINCVGVGTAKRLKGDYSRYFMVTEEYDNLVIRYLLQHPDTLYISFSSGAVYGKAHSAPVEEDSLNRIPVNHVAPEDYYGIVRLNSEAKHRAFRHLNIVDLRVFSYFSRFIDLSDGYFITEVMESILNRKVLVTDSSNMMRDYLHHEDLFSMISKCIDIGRMNTAFDVVSAKPVEKREILELFSLEYGLRYETSQTMDNTSATGAKNIYCSNYDAAFRIGYTPGYTSIAALKEEAKYILCPHKQVGVSRHLNCQAAESVLGSRPNSNR